MPLASSTASSNVSYAETVTTGPKTSSHDTFACGGAPAITVGLMTVPSASPPVSTSAPSDRASSIHVEDALAGVVVDHRADVGLLVGRITGLQRLDAGEEALEEARRRPARWT